MLEHGESMTLREFDALIERQSGRHHMPRTHDLAATEQSDEDPDLSLPIASEFGSYGLHKDLDELACGTPIIMTFLTPSIQD